MAGRITDPDVLLIASIAAGRDTAWIKIIPDDAPSWLEGRGGHLSQAHALIAELASGS